jgi:RNA polymerase sigma factor (sigma-70 family)
MSAHALPSLRSGLRSPRAHARRDDEELRALAAAGDADALATLYERHHQGLYRYCRSIVRHDEDARDALHNAWVRAWAALQAGDRDVPVRPWLFRIVHNEAVTVLRRRRHHDELAGVAALGGPVLEHDVEIRDRLAVLRSDLAELPERQRSALLLRELCGLGHEEIAAVFAISPAAAKQSIYEGRRALQEAEAGRDMICADVQRTLSDGDGRVRRGRRMRAHLRGCDACRSFDAALRRRPADLAALAPPLPAAAAAGLAARLLGEAGGHGAAAVAGAAGVAAPSGGLSALGAGVSGKLAVVAALATSAGAGTVQAIHHGRVATPPKAAEVRLSRAPAPRALLARTATTTPASVPAVALRPVGAPARPAAQHVRPHPVHVPSQAMAVRTTPGHRRTASSPGSGRSTQARTRHATGHRAQPPVPTRAAPGPHPLPKTPPATGRGRPADVHGPASPKVHAAHGAHTAVSATPPAAATQPAAAPPAPAPAAQRPGGPPPDHGREGKRPRGPAPATS